MLKICAIVLTFYSLFGAINCELGFENGGYDNGYQLNAPLVQLGYDNERYTNGNGNGFENEEATDGLSAIPGEPGIDYPTYDKVPETSFQCENFEFPGYYADREARCQVFHICQAGNRKDSFLCPNGTLFNQEFLVCDWWNRVDCDRAEDFYSINESIFREMQEASERLMQEAARRAQEQQGEGGYDYTPAGNYSLLM